jgi:ABC-type nitrate/sulfonate/bicarbonate transport system substrate-binding protein
MGTLKVLYRDVDRTPYLFTLRQCARRYGLDLDVEMGGFGREAWEVALETGKVQVLAENYWGLQGQAAAGMPVVALTAAVSTWTDKLLADASVQTVADLRGKRLAVRGLGPQEHLPGLWLKDQGLAGAVEPVVYAERDTGRWGHWKKVVDGECQAAFVNGVYAEAARAAGLHEIPFESYGFAGNVTLATSEAVIQQSRQDVQHLVNAAFDASRLFKTDAAAALKIMREEAAEHLQRQLDVSSDERLEQVYRAMRDELADMPVPTAEALANTRRMLLDVAPELRTYNPLLMWDFSFAREAQRRAAAS